MTNMYSPSLIQEHEDEPEARDDDIDDEELPSEAQFVLLCLDHLRDLRRAYPHKQDLLQAEGLDADYLSVAIYALSRVFLDPLELSHFESNGNDAHLDWERANERNDGQIFPVKDPPSSKNFISIPNLQSINQEIFYSSEDEEYIYNDGHPSNAHRFYPLDGLASGPSLRGPLTLGEVTVAGLAGLGARSRIAAELDVRDSPLFDQFVAAVRSKGFFRDPDTEQPRSDPDDEKERLARAAEIQEERLGKVMGKVRTKLAHKAQQQLEDNVGEVPPLYHDYFVLSAAERLERRRMTHVQQVSNGERGGAAPLSRPPLNVYSSSQSSATSSPEQLVRRPSPSKRVESPYSAPATPTSTKQPVRRPSPSKRSESPYSPAATPTAKQLVRQPSPSKRSESPYSPASTTRNMPPSSPSVSVNKTLSIDTPGLQHVSSSTLTSPVMNTKSARSPSPSQQRAAPSPVAVDNPADIQQAERLKTVGNAHMQNKEYAQAAEAYTAALAKSPNGPHTHVYYSNRAAALLSLKRFDDAISDSERSLALKPDYGKAHARLGLAHFLLGNYRLAVEAYTISLKYEPDNKSTKNYLQKAAKRAAAMEASGESNNNAASGSNSFSFVSEQERSDSAKKKRKGSNSPGLPMPEENDERTTKRREKEAEKVKLKGNSYMSNRDYEAALTNYTLAIKLSPEGPNSHVYYSNRAAALCYLERYEEAEADSEYSLVLNPTYGKAHARLGLSRFFIADYAGAIDAYNSALEYDPDNAASKSYLAKARARLAKQGGSETRSARKSTPKAMGSPAIPSSKDSFDEIMNANLTQTDAAATSAEI